MEDNSIPVTENKDIVSTNDVNVINNSIIKDNYNKYLFTLSFLIILIDQLTKIYVKGFNLFGIEREGYFIGERIASYFSDIITITFVENPGMAWGIEFGVFKIVLSLFSFVAGGALIVYLVKINGYNLGVRTGFTLIMAGALGNGIDRVFYGAFYGESALFYGKVVDFIRVDIPDVFGMTHWPVFNVADASVSCGVVLLLIFNKHIPSLDLIFPKLFKKNDDNTKSNKTHSHSNTETDKKLDTEVHNENQSNENN